jgi:N-glycosylase/DNA lyase
MRDLLHNIQNLQKSHVARTVSQRIEEFYAFSSKNSRYWFSELCFCILAANAKGATAYKIQKELGIDGCCSFPKTQVLSCIKKNKHRFHNNKASFILAARNHLNIKKKIISIVGQQGLLAAREWLVNNIKGIGYKEASHFLRNVGYPDLAILDRHILALMTEAGIIPIQKNPLTKVKYLKIEKKFIQLSRQLCMKPGELDLYMWYLRTGCVLK